MGRLFGLKFDIAVFTNIKSEHLGYHKTWENYAHAKSLLITKHLKEGGVVILNADDGPGYDYINKIATNKITYSINQESKSNVNATNVIETNNGVTYSVQNRTYSLPILGLFNVSNALASSTALEPFGIPLEKSLLRLVDFTPVVGRMNVIQKEPFTVIVDFAHTPNGLLNVLQTVNKFKKTGKRIILVFGCAAKRDEYKRPLMGEYAKQYADITILTAEDCRAEGLKNINDQIALGWKRYNTKDPRELIRFDDESQNVQVRLAAIEKALALARSGDIVLITGKGHEMSLCFGTTEYPWNDINITKELLNKNK